MKPLRLAPAWFATCMMVLPAPGISADEPSLPSPSVRPPVGLPSAIDVELSASQMLQGRVVDWLGKPQGNRSLEVERWGQGPTWTSRTDEAGSFEISGLRGGTYELRCGTARQVVRIWIEGTAPPRSVRHVTLLAPDDAILRGQQPLPNFFCNEPIMIGLLVAAAVAIPLAVHSSEDRPPGS
ncbi:MAG TPA: carboxypeptidase-like regulatory domain-containing protein [Pirellulaceae bacterium]